MYRKTCLSQKRKLFTNGLNMDLPQRGCVKKTVDGVEKHRLSTKEN